MDFIAAPTAETAVKIGESNQSTNKVGINVTANSQLPPGTKVRVTVTVGCGATAADLLAPQNESVKVTWKPGGKTTPNMTPAPSPSTGKKAWNTGTFPTDLPVSISFGDFVSNTPPGDAVITVLVETSTGRNEWSKGESFSIQVKKELEPRAKPEIRYFTVNPNYILHAGQTEVTVSFCATGYETLTLFRNNEEVQNWTDPGGKSPSIIGAFLDKPSITSVYRLEGKYKKQDQTEVRDALDRTVQVISPGWNQIALRQGSPVRLFMANDFSGSGSDRLYGIFKDGGGAYALYSSATGVDAWRLEPGDVPPHMATSPGVYYKNKLWLIGGSSVDPDNPGNEVWCYEADENATSRYWKRKSDFVSEMPARMGHACVVFKEKILVIGGYNNAAFNDVWSLTESNDGILWAKLVDTCGWAPRLNPAAATCKRGKGQDQVWIYGGSTSPQSDPLANEFWSTTDGINWQDMSKGQDVGSGDDRPVPIIPDPGAPLASALVAFPQTDSSGTVQGNRLILMGSFQEWKDKRDSNSVLGNRIFSFLFEWHPGTALWDARPVFDGWQQFAGQNFYMQAVVYNRFLFCWSLQNDPNFTGRLNILVSR